MMRNATPSQQYWKNKAMNKSVGQSATEKYMRARELVDSEVEKHVQRLSQLLDKRLKKDKKIEEIQNDKKAEREHKFGKIQLRRTEIR